MEQNQIETRDQESFQDRLKRLLASRKPQLEKLIDDFGQDYMNSTEICLSESTAYSENIARLMEHHQLPDAP